MSESNQAEELAYIEHSARQKSYFVPAVQHETEIEIKRSRFITTGIYAATDQDVKRLIETLRMREPNANHHCSDYVLGQPAQPIAAGSSDDGEPSGTAGKPMLNQLLSANIGHCAVVVTRYFGGIKLGAGGLIRAYGAAVRSLTEEWTLESREPALIFELEYDYGHTAQIESLISRFHAEVLWADYSSRIAQHIQVTAVLGLELRETLQQLAYLGISYQLRMS